MGKFDGGIKYYTSGIASIKVNFPEDEVCCKYCEYCYAESGLNRCKCRILHEIIYSPNYGRLENCPIKITINENK